MTQTKTCDECNGKMQEGYVLELSHGGMYPSIWIEGEPESNVWDGLQTKGKIKYMISAYRCEKCGYLKFYAIYGRTEK